MQYHMRVRRSRNQPRGAATGAQDLPQQRERSGRCLILLASGIALPLLKGALLVFARGRRLATTSACYQQSGQPLLLEPFHQLTDAMRLRKFCCGRCLGKRLLLRDRKDHSGSSHRLHAFTAGFLPATPFPFFLPAQRMQRMVLGRDQGSVFHLPTRSLTGHLFAS